MKICMPHWDKLRAALKARGIDQIGAKTGAEAVDAIVEEFSGGDPAYDPTMDCNNMIWSRALQAGGLYLMGVKDDGTEYCPVCEVVAHGNEGSPEDRERYWIDGPAEAALDRCRSLGLVPAVQ